MGRTRSPAHPFVGLPTALEKARALFEAIQRNPASREIIAHGLGFNRLHGQSRRFIATLIQFDLLEKAGDELQISELAIACLLAETEEEKASALRRAASSPKLFQNLQTKYSSSVPGEEMASNWLMREGFSPDGAKRAAKAYRETMLFVEGLAEVSDAEVDSLSDEIEMEASTAVTQDSVNASISGLEPGQIVTKIGPDSLVDVQGVKLGPEEVTRLRDMLNHFLGTDNGQASPALLPHDD